MFNVPDTKNNNTHAVSAAETEALDDVPASNATSRDLRRIARKLKETLAERDNLIIQATKEGASLRAIGADLGVDHVTVRYRLNKIERGAAAEQHRERMGIDEDSTRNEADFVAFRDAEA